MPLMHHGTLPLQKRKTPFFISLFGMDWLHKIEVAFFLAECDGIDVAPSHSTVASQRPLHDFKNRPR